MILAIHKSRYGDRQWIIGWATYYTGEQSANFIVKWARGFG